MLPLTKIDPFYPGQWGIPGSDDPRGVRTLPEAMVFYVSSTHPEATDANDGTDPNHPMATIDAAIGRCTANHGDEIHVAPGHAESIATAGAINCDIAGVKIKGYGSGQLRPRISFTNIAATVAIASANVTFENFLFLVGVDSLPIMIDVNADDFGLVNCEFRENTAVAQQWLTCVDINGGGANLADRTKIYGCTFISMAAGANYAINIGAVQDGIELVGNKIYGDFAVAGIGSGSACTNLTLKANTVHNYNAGNFAVELTAAADGAADDNRFYSNAVATCFDPGSLKCNGNLYTDAVDQSGVPIPATAAGPLPAGSIDAATFAAGAIDATAIAAGAIDQATFAADTILGADNGANAFTSINVTQDRDGSIIERQEFLMKVIEIAVEKADGTTPLGQDDLFTITGGPIIVTELVGLCTLAVGGASNCHIDVAVADPVADVAMSTDVAVGALISGGSISFTNVALPVLTPTAAGAVVSVPAPRWLCPAGTIKAHFSAAQAGTWRWFLCYKPLSPAVTVVAAP